MDVLFGDHFTLKNKRVRLMECREHQKKKFVHNRNGHVRVLFNDTVHHICIDMVAKHT